MSRRVLLPLLILFALPAACTSSPAVPEGATPVAAPVASGVSTQQIAERHGLRERFDIRRNRLVLENTAHRVVLFPGTTVAVVDGDRVGGMEKIRLGDGTCLLEPEDAESIDRLLRRRNSLPATTPYRPRPQTPPANPQPGVTPPPPPGKGTLAAAVRIPLKRKWKYIVLHHSGTAAGSAESFDHNHRVIRGWNGLGYHFVVGNGNGAQNGGIEVGYRWKGQLTGAHAGRTPDGGNLMNETGIGICLVGNFDVTKPTAKQLNTLTQLIAELRRHCAIPAENVLLHRDVRGTDCPGKLFPAARFQVKGGVKSSSP